MNARGAYYGLVEAQNLRGKNQNEEEVVVERPTTAPTYQRAFSVSDQHQQNDKIVTKEEETVKVTIINIEIIRYSFIVFSILDLLHFLLC